MVFQACCASDHLLKMDGILQLLKPVLESKSKDQTLKNLLTSCADQRAFSKV